MSTADDASTLRRRRPPVVRINLEPNEDASDSAQSSPRAASDSSGAGPTGSPRSESSHGSRSAQSSPRAPSAAGSSPRSFSELRVDIPRGRASPSPLESFLRSVVEAPATQRPQEIEEEDDEDDDALAVASLRRVARHLRGGMSREDCADELERLAANLARTPLARAARARRKASKMMINGLRRVGKRDKVVFDGVYTDEDSARDVVKWGPWSPTLRRISSSERLVATPSPTTRRKLINWAVHPNSAFKRRWDYLTSLLAVCVVFKPELRALAALLLGLEAPKKEVVNMWALAFNRCVNFWFLVDVCLNFVTGYVDRKTGVLVMSKRRIAQRYLRTYFVLDIWCALPFDRLVLPALVEVAPPQKPLKCAPGSSDMLLVDCLPRRRPLRAFRRALGYVPRVLSFAKGRGRLRQVLVGAPTIVGHVRRFFRLLRASRVRLVKWRALAVLGRRYRKNAKAYFNRLPSPSFLRSPKAVYRRLTRTPDHDVASPERPQMRRSVTNPT
jgi:hypothetical protein